MSDLQSAHDEPRPVWIFSVVWVILFPKKKNIRCRVESIFLKNSYKEDLIETENDCMKTILENYDITNNEIVSINTINKIGFTNKKY